MMAGRAQELVFLFSPQGVQWPGMGRKLFRDDLIFRRKIAECDAEVQRELGWSLVDDFVSDAGCPLDDEHIQPAVTALQIALAEVLRSRGVLPAAVAGLSMGEPRRHRERRRPLGAGSHARRLL